jgi:hypothetical protein
MSNTSSKVLLFKLLCMTDNELIDFFQTNYDSLLPNEFHYKWRKRLSIYSSTFVTSHEYKWMADALRCHVKDEIALLRSDISWLLNDDEKSKDEKKNNDIKKVQSCPLFQSSLHSLHFHNVHEILEKTVNGC